MFVDVYNAVLECTHVGQAKSSATTGRTQPSDWSYFRLVARQTDGKMAEYTRLKIVPHGAHVVEVSLNRPERSNAMDTRLWQEVGHYFGSVVPNLAGCRCVVLTGQGRNFSGGIDLQNSPLDDAAGGGDKSGGEISNGDEADDDDQPDAAAAALRVLRMGTAWQRSWTALAECGRPVIAAVQGACIGAALELISAADIRLCSRDAFFAAPEVDVGIAADIGGLQRFPKIIGNDSLMRELMLTARRMGSAEALSLGAWCFFPVRPNAENTRRVRTP
jgi:delta(3,5)-delta(2,4)-dienoyl-CoA isomerase